MGRKLIVSTAQGYYEAAKGLNTDGEVYSMSEKLCCMEQALNHTENKLVYALNVLREVLVWEVQDDDNYLGEELRKKIEKLIEE
jgi:hypothetical protein